MKGMSDVLKGVLLLGALLILALTSLPSSSDAQTSVTCEGAGHTCHAIDGGGVTHHYKLIPAT